MNTNFNPSDKITVDVPLFIRLLEYAREDAKTDMDLHDLAEKAITLSETGKTLTMNDYDSLVTSIPNNQEMNELKRMQKLAGLLKEDNSQDAEQIVNKVEDSLEAKIDKLSPEQIQQLQAELNKLGITANTSVEDAAQKIQGSLDEAEGDDKKKLASTLQSIGTGLIGSMLVPIIPLAIGQGTGLGTAAGFGITFAAGGLLVGLAKALRQK
jgi:VIT1/CCC1 family predicted Fe2+/Mn2+ transporter